MFDMEAYRCCKSPWSCRQGVVHRILWPLERGLLSKVLLSCGLLSCGPMGIGPLGSGGLDKLSMRLFRTHPVIHLMHL